MTEKHAESSKSLASESTCDLISTSLTSPPKRAQLQRLYMANDPDNSYAQFSEFSGPT